METAKKKDRCFIITPIGKETDDIRRHIDGIIEAVIKPVIEEDYDVIVSHKMNDLGSINKQVIKEIYNDKLVIANLTSINPNVMYELAFRHSIGKPVIIIAEKGTSLPFDISDGRTIFYRNDAQGTLELQKLLKQFIDAIDFSKPTSPIYDVLGELKKETALLDNIKSASSNGDSNSLEYILKRLDSIESSIKSIGQNRIQHSKRTKGLTKAIKIEYEYDTILGPAKEESMLNSILKSNTIIRTSKYPYYIDDVSISEEEKTIQIVVFSDSEVFEEFQTNIVFEIQRELEKNGVQFSKNGRANIRLFS